MGGAVRQTAAMAFLGSKIPKRLKKSISKWMSGDHRSSLSRNIAMEGEGLLGVIRMAAVNHEARYYMLRKARYPASREVEVARSTAWALARNEGATLDSNGYPYSPTSPAQDTGKLDKSSGDELFGSD